MSGPQMSQAASSVAARSFEGAPTVGFELPPAMPQEQRFELPPEMPQEQPQASSGAASSEAQGVSTVGSLPPSFFWRPQAASGAASSEAPQEQAEASSDTASSEAPQEEPQPLPAAASSPASPPGSASRPWYQVNASSAFPFSIDAHQIGACCGKVHWAWVEHLLFRATPDSQSHVAALCPGVDLQLCGLDARGLGPYDGDIVLAWDFVWSEGPSRSPWATPRLVATGYLIIEKAPGTEWGLGAAWGMGFENQDISFALSRLVERHALTFLVTPRFGAMPGPHSQEMRAATQALGQPQPQAEASRDAAQAQAQALAEASRVKARILESIADQVQGLERAIRSVAFQLDNLDNLD